MCDNQCIKDFKVLFPSRWMDLDYNSRKKCISQIKGIDVLFLNVENNKSLKYSDGDRIDFFEQLFNGKFEEYGYCKSDFSYSDQIGLIFFNSLKTSDSKVKALQCCRLDIIRIASKILESNDKGTSEKLINFVDICVKAGVEEKHLSKILLDLQALDDNLINRYFGILGSGEIKYPHLQHNLLLRAEEVSTILDNFEFIPYDFFWNHLGRYKGDYLSYLSIADLASRIIRIENGFDDNVEISLDIMADKPPSSNIIRFIKKTNSISGNSTSELFISSYRLQVVKYYGGDDFLSLLEHATYNLLDLMSEIISRLKKGLFTEEQAVRGIQYGKRWGNGFDFYMFEIGKVLTQRSSLLDLLDSMDDYQYIEELINLKCSVLTYSDIYGLISTKCRNDYKRKIRLYGHIPNFDSVFAQKIGLLASEIMDSTNVSDGKHVKILMK